MKHYMDDSNYSIYQERHGRKLTTNYYVVNYLLQIGDEYLDSFLDDYCCFVYNERASMDFLLNLWTCLSPMQLQSLASGDVVYAIDGSSWRVVDIYEDEYGKMEVRAESETIHGNIITLPQGEVYGRDTPFFVEPRQSRQQLNNVKAMKAVFIGKNK